MRDTFLGGKGLVFFCFFWGGGGERLVNSWGERRSGKKLGRRRLGNRRNTSL